jgi:AcrR family transcriptional regulator
LCRALIAAVAEAGYAEVTVADIVRRARVSRVAFYAHFRGKEECFLAATREGGQLMSDRVVAATRAVPANIADEEVLRAGFRAFLQFLADEPAFARVFYIDMQAAGSRAVKRFDAAELRFAEMTATWHRRARARHPDWPVVPNDAYVALSGATVKLVRSAVRNGETHELPKLEDTILSVHLAVLAARPWPSGVEAASAESGAELSTEVSRRHLLRHDHAPGIGDELAHLVAAEDRHPRVDPVEALIGQPRQHELGRLGRDQRGPFLFRETEPHDRLIRGDRDVDDAADPELDLIVDQVLGGARQRHRYLAHLRSGDQRFLADHAVLDGGRGRGMRGGGDRRRGAEQQRQADDDCDGDLAG